MPKLKTEQIGVITLLNEDGSLKGIIYKESESHKNIFYTCTEMNFEELESLFKENNKI